MKISDKITDRLRALSDEKYADFHSKLIPGIPKERIIGVKIPLIRKLAAELSKEDTEEFLSRLPHDFYDENVLHSAILCGIKDYETALYETERFLPYIDNWAVCDTLSPKGFKKSPERLSEKIDLWIRSDHTYTVRFGIETLMRYFLDGERFDEKYLHTVASIRTDEYYVRMMQAWYMATALAKQWDCAVKILENNEMEIPTHNQTVKKARESFRITEERKEYLNTLKIKA